MFNNQLTDQAFINSLIAGSAVSSDFTNQQNYMMEEFHKLEKCFTNTNWQLNINNNYRNNIIYNSDQNLKYNIDEIWNNIDKVGKTILKESGSKKETFKIKKLKPSHYAKEMLSMENKQFEDQVNIINDFAQHVDLQYAYTHENSNIEPNQLFTLVHAGPGTGKTWTLKKMVQILEEFNLEFLVTAFTGISCSIIEGADTINSSFIIPVTKKDEATNVPVDFTNKSNKSNFVFIFKEKH